MVEVWVGVAGSGFLSTGGPLVLVCFVARVLSLKDRLIQFRVLDYWGIRGLLRVLRNHVAACGRYLLSVLTQVAAPGTNPRRAPQKLHLTFRDPDLCKQQQVLSAVFFEVPKSPESPKPLHV